MACGTANEIFFINPNPSPGVGLSFADKLVKLPFPVTKILLVSRNNGNLYLHFAPLNKQAVASVFPVVGNEAWIPLYSPDRKYPIIELRRPIDQFYLTGDGGGTSPADFSLALTCDIVGETGEEAASVSSVNVLGQPLSVTISGQPISVNSNVQGQPISVTSSRVKTYSAAGFFVTTNTSNQPLCALQNPVGSLVTVRIRKIYVHVHTSGTAAGVFIQAFFCTSLTSSTGTTVLLTPQKHDQNNPTSALFNNVTEYTTTGTSVGANSGPFRSLPMNNGSFTAPISPIYIDPYEDLMDVQPITLRPGQEVNIQITSVVANQTVCINWEWTEE